MTTPAPPGPAPVSERPWTAGPWHYSPFDDGGDDPCFFIGNEDENAAVVPGYTDHPRNIANARLVAAAPELFEALQELLELTCGRRALTAAAQIRRKAERRARAALRAASGEDVAMKPHVRRMLTEPHVTADAVCPTCRGFRFVANPHEMGGGLPCPTCNPRGDQTTAKPATGERA